MGNKWSATPSLTSEISIEEDEPPDEPERKEKLTLVLLNTKNLELSNVDPKNGKIHTLIRIKSSFNAQIYTKPIKYSNNDQTCPWLLPNTKFVFAGSAPSGEIVVSLVQSNLPPLPAIPSSTQPLNVSQESKIEKVVCIAKLHIPLEKNEFANANPIKKWIKVDNFQGDGNQTPEVLVGLKYTPAHPTRILKVGETIADRYEVDDVLGTGQNIVKKAKSKLSKKQYAIKFIPKQQKGLKVPKQHIDNEIKLLKTLSHENIVQLCESVESSDTVYVVMELVEGVDLFDVNKTLGSLRPAVVGNLIGQLMSALAYLHSLGIAHHDIKPENVLVDYAASKVKLTDFGSAKEVKKMTGVGGTLNYMAPELLNRMRGLNQNCDQFVDIWGIGVVTYQLLSGSHPFDYGSKCNPNIINRVLSGKFDFSAPVWDSVPKHCKDFIQKCLVLDPKKRSSAQELLKHPWILSSTGTSEAMFSDIEKERLEKQRSSRNNSRSNSMQSLLELFGNGSVPSRA